MALIIRREILDQSSREIILDVFQQSKLSNGKLDGVSYRADHEDWIERINDLESRQLLKREGNYYRVGFVVLSVLDDPDAKLDLRRCENAFNVLRAHYKNSHTRNMEKKISELANDIGCSYGEAVKTVRYLMDVSGEWHGGSSTDLENAETAYIKPAEWILGNKTFTDLVKKVKEWHEVDRSSSSGNAVVFPYPFSPPENEGSGNAVRKKKNAKSNDIFIVHGHDHDSKESVARFIKKLGLNPIILHEKPNAGRTIIEKFSDYADVSFAVVLLTDDDEGKPKKFSTSLKPRARQNVILELGYFLGKLGRANVCALHKDGVEIPSDYQGVLFVPFDTSEQWKSELVRELKEAGFTVDTNRISTKE